MDLRRFVFILTFCQIFWGIPTLSSASLPISDGFSIENALEESNAAPSLPDVDLHFTATTSLQKPSSFALVFLATDLVALFPFQLGQVDKRGPPLSL